jgi:hypothetical protein
VALRILPPKDYLPGMAFDLFVFQGWLPEAWPPGVVVVIEPPKDSSLLPVRGLENVRSLPVPATDPLLADVDFSGVRWSKVWALEALPEGFESLLQADRLSLLARGRAGFSQVYLLLPDLRSGNLTRHPTFPVLLANLVQSVGKVTLPTSLPAGEALPLPPPEGYPRLRILPPTGEAVTLAANRPAVWPDTLEPGIYRLDLTDLDGRVHSVAVGVNAGDAIESAIGPQAWTAGPADGTLTASAPVETVRTVNLMPWLVGLAVLFLILEARLAWR